MWKRNIIISALILLSIGISGCIDDPDNEPNTIPIHQGDVILSILLDEYNYTEVPEDLGLHLKLYNNGSEEVEYDDWLDTWVKIHLTFPNGSSRWISPWANITRELNLAYLSPGENIEWSRTITYHNISADFFDPDEFYQKGTYLIQAVSGNIMSNIIKIYVS